MILDDHDVEELFRILHSPGEERDRVLRLWQEHDWHAVSAKLQEFITDPDPDTRGHAAEALVRINREAAIEAVLDLFNDPDPGVRWHLCGLMYDRGDNRATNRLVSVLRHDSEPFVRLIAADALGKIRDPAALLHLEHAAQHDHAEWQGRTVADAARAAIERITTPPKPRWS